MYFPQLECRNEKTATKTSNQKIPPLCSVSVYNSVKQSLFKLGERQLL